MTSNWRIAAVLLAGWIAAVVLSGPAFSFVEDEATQTIDAARPVPAIVGEYWFAKGERQQHPPLSDVVLHFWLPVAGASPSLLRLLSAIFFVAGLILLAFAAVRLAGQGAFLPALCLGIFSPYTFHIARLAGWYSFCFFLVGWLTLGWLNFLETRRARSMVGLIIPAILLVYSNYLGWLLVALLLIDGLIVSGRRMAKQAAVVLGAMAVAFLPLFNAFFYEILHGGRSRGAHPERFVSNILLAGFNLYSIFLSESVAPWFWFFSIPASVALILCLWYLLRLLTKRQKLFLLYFAVAFGALALGGLADVKRCLFLCGWLILALAAGLANREAAVTRRKLIGLVCFVAALGWTGTVLRRWYSAPHLIEPWAEVAREATGSLKPGSSHAADVVVSNSPAFLFHLNYAMADAGRLKHPFIQERVFDNRVLTVPKWSADRPIDGVTVLFVRGVDQGMREATSRIESEFQSQCTLLEASRLLHDSGSALKEKLFPQFEEPPYRISIDRYACSGKHPALRSSTGPSPGATFAGARKSPRKSAQ